MCGTNPFMKLIFRLFAVSLTLCLIACNRHPTDVLLKRKFEKDSSSLSNIVTFLKQNKNVTRIDLVDKKVIAKNSDNTILDVSGEIKQEILNIDGVVGVVSAGNGNQVWFDYSRKGLSVSGSTKGILYQTDVPDRVVDDTDKSAQANKPFTTCSMIKSNWYVFYSF